MAAWLVRRQRTREAVELLSAWAARGPNDSHGQKLLGDALRVDQASPLAKMAFERMQGIAGEHLALEEAILKYDRAELDRLEKEMSTGAFRRAQVGFNDNLKYKGRVYHIQTEDSGIDKPQILTHLFADGGRVLKSYKRTYAEELSREDLDGYVRALMKAQQMEMASALREGKLDAVIDGRETGGMELRTEPPKLDLQRLSTKNTTVPRGVFIIQRGAEKPKEPPPPPAPPAPKDASAREAKAGEAAATALARSATAAKDAAAAKELAERLAKKVVSSRKVRVRLQVLRSLTGGPEEYAPLGDEVILGRDGAVALTGERFCHPREAVIKYRNGRLILEDIDGGNGVFLRIRRPVELAIGDEFIVGDQLLRIERNPDPDDHPDPDPTYFWSSPKPVSPFRIVQVFEGGAEGACVMARGTTLQVGAAVGDLVFPNDPLVSDYHCLVEEQAGTVVLTDLASRTGVFVRIQGMQELVHGDEMLVGRTRLLVDLAGLAG
ncbi:MAG: FHA domain-containing protein [Polyangiaceae bacterium]